MVGADQTASPRIRPRLELPEDDFIVLKAHAVRTRVTLGHLIETAIADWLEREEPAPSSPPLGDRVVRHTVSLPEDLHTRLKLRAVYGRTTMQVLMRAALAPVLTAARTADPRRP